MKYSIPYAGDPLCWDILESKNLKKNRPTAKALIQTPWPLVNNSNGRIRREKAFFLLQHLCTQSSSGLHN